MSCICFLKLQDGLYIMVFHQWLHIVMLGKLQFPGKYKTTSQAIRAGVNH